MHLSPTWRVGERKRPAAESASGSLVIYTCSLDSERTIASKRFQYDVFLSHNAKDKPRVRRLAERLRDAGLRVWFDERVPPGGVIARQVDEGLEQSRVLLFCMSPHSLLSEWVGLEVSTAIHRDPSNSRGRFVPLLLTDCDLPDTFRRYKYVDYRDESDPAFDELLKACRKRRRSVENAKAYPIPLPDSNPAAEERKKLDMEIAHRLPLLPVLLEDVFTFTQLHSAKGAVLGSCEIRPGVGKLGEFDPLFPEFRNRSLFILLWNLRERLAEADKSTVDRAMESAKALPHLFRHLVMLAPVGEEDSKWQIDRKHLNHTRAVLRGLKCSRWAGKTS